MTLAATAPRIESLEFSMVRLLPLAWFKRQHVNENRRRVRYVLVN
jgi:hypothetical protein